MIKKLFLGLLVTLHIQAFDILYVRDSIKKLEAAVALGNNKALYNLGLLYAQDILLDDSEVFKKDLKKAKKYFNLALLKHYNQAAYDLSVILISEKKYFEALNMLERVLNDEVSDKMRAVLVYQYSDIVLSNFTTNEVLVNKTAKYVEEILSFNLSIFQYIYANILFIQKKDELATKYVTKACKHPKRNEKLIRICKSYEDSNTSTNTK